jgi:hypothetical protein
MPGERHRSPQTISGSLALCLAAVYEFPEVPKRQDHTPELEPHDCSVKNPNNRVRDRPS